MADDWYFDEPDVGPAPETSHPRFRELAVDEFFYDPTDDFSPFGNDDGSDTLSALEDWFRDGGANDDVASFVYELLDDWELVFPTGHARTDRDRFLAWVNDAERNESHGGSECQVWVAAAFGQMKVTGRIDRDVKAEALAALDRQLWLNHRARKNHPDWPGADLERQRINRMRELLSRSSPSD